MPGCHGLLDMFEDHEFGLQNSLQKSSQILIPLAPSSSLQ